jgi:hypothetical protein
VIIRDDKDWTWVLAAPCPECRFDAGSCPAQSVATLIRENANDWRRLLDGGTIRAVRPNDYTWSPLEYACHVRDVYRRYDHRIELMQNANDPLFPNWDQDASAVDDRYNEQDPEQVVSALVVAAATLARRLETIDGEAWERSGRRSDGASFTIATIARYMIHDAIHHIWDVTGQRPSVGHGPGSTS